ncbi:LysR family transcriptional regulator [Lactobacillus sp. CBA3605]|uniref:LysR family transcriptional regulator n=1 Tax=Lactobacillus sp. CBA3605 TaxID=2099788 RepID=UPI000CFB0F86|nr:LysR family transcriptional regulator [Lactobacillus sp. CBA3605]AVK60893.1 LysR family transcriptional regulator [Lactobacillus sp. CBA3605]
MTQFNSPNMLHYLDTLLKYGNYTKAAKSLYISQPYLTQLIQRTEKELAIEIINRQNSPLQLTEAGQLYYQYLSSLETEQATFRKTIAKYSAVKQTVIRIGVLSSLGTYLLPLFLPQYLTAHPQIKVELYEDIPTNNEQKILAGDLDLLIGQNPETISPKLTSYHRGPHGYNAIIPAFSHLYQPDRLLLEPNTVPIKTLLQEKLILTTRGSAIRRQVDYLAHKYKIQPTITLESNNIFTIVNLAKRGLGLTFLPESVQITPQPGIAPNFNIYPLPLDLLSLNYFIAHPADKTLRPAEKELIQTFLEQLTAALN